MNELFIEFVLSSFVAWCSMYDNKDKKEDFNDLYNNIYECIKKSDIRALKKIDYFNELKDIKNKIF